MLAGLNDKTKQSSTSSNIKYRCERILKASDTCTTLLVRASDTGSLYVMKRSNHAFASKSMIVGEADVLKRASGHSNIVAFIESFEDEAGRSVLITEWCEGGDLADWLASKDYERRSSVASMILKQLSSALMHIHSKNILHRDLKPRNIFVNTDHGKLTLKIGDFGVSKEACLAETALGTPFYLCPEIVLGKPYSFPSDIWALGCVMYEVIKGLPPFSGKSLCELLMAISKHHPSPLPHHNLTNKLTMDCLNKDPKGRPSAAEIHNQLACNEKPTRRFEKEDCVALLMERFGKDTALDILECLKKPHELLSPSSSSSSSSSSSPHQPSSFERAKKAYFKKPEGNRLIQRIVRLRQELDEWLDEDLLEKALHHMKNDCEEKDIAILVGHDLHNKLLQQDAYVKIKELVFLEGSFLSCLV